MPRYGFSLKYSVTNITDGACPKGTTEKAVAVLEQGGIQELFLDAMTAATKRAEEIGEMYL